MEDKPSSSRAASSWRGPVQASVRQALNDATLQLSLLQRRVGGRLGLRDVDFECFNLIQNEGPLTPAVLARRAGLHPATLTGVLDRLERSGWVTREHDPHNRRSVLVRALRERNKEVFAQLQGMNNAMSDVIGRYNTTELEAIVDFLRRTVEAARQAAEAFE